MPLDLTILHIRSTWTFEQPCVVALLELIVEESSREVGG